MELFILYKASEDKGFYERNIGGILAKEKFLSDLMGCLVGIYTTEELAKEAKSKLNDPECFGIHSIEYK